MKKMVEEIDLWTPQQGHVLPLSEWFQQCCRSPGWAGTAGQSLTCTEGQSHPTPDRAKIKMYIFNSTTITSSATMLDRQTILFKMGPQWQFLAQSVPYLRYKVANERDVCVELLQALADVSDHRQHVAPTQQVDHTIQQCLLQLHLKGTTLIQSAKNSSTESLWVVAWSQIKPTHAQHAHLLHDVKLGVFCLK